jgi:hypothetical protein
MNPEMGEIATIIETIMLRLMVLLCFTVQTPCLNSICLEFYV